MTAKEAREIATSINNSVNQAQYNKVLEAIRQTANQGETRMVYTGQLSRGIQAKLVELGYGVVYTSGDYHYRESSYYTITW